MRFIGTLWIAPTQDNAFYLIDCIAFIFHARFYFLTYAGTDAKGLVLLSLPLSNGGVSAYKITQLISSSLDSVSSSR